MTRDDSRTPATDLPARIALLRAASEGRLDNLPCPKCGHDRVSVWFTHPSVDLYRTWFVCENCDFEMRAQDSGLPPHYSADRDRTTRTPAVEPA